MTTVGTHTVPSSELQAALFDVDGTLVDSMPRFFPSWNDACAPHGLSLSEDEFYAFAGWPLPDIVREIHRRGRGGATPDDAWVAEFMRAKKASHAAREAVVGPPPPIVPVVAIARAHAAAGVPVVAATSGLRDHVEARHGVALRTDRRSNCLRRRPRSRASAAPPPVIPRPTRPDHAPRPRWSRSS